MMTHGITCVYRSSRNPNFLARLEWKIPVELMRTATAQNSIGKGYRSHRWSYGHETLGSCGPWASAGPFRVQGQWGQINFVKFWKNGFCAKNKKGDSLPGTFSLSWKNGFRAKSKNEGELTWFCSWLQGALGLYWFLGYPLGGTTARSLHILQTHVLPCGYSRGALFHKYLSTGNSSFGLDNLRMHGSGALLGTFPRSWPVV